MKSIETLVRDYTKREYHGFGIVPVLPSWLEAVRWKPSFLLANRNQTKFLGIDLILSGSIPAFQYTKIVSQLLEEYTNFKVIVVVLEESYEENPEIREYCSEAGIGLKVAIPGIGIQTIVKCAFDEVPETGKLPVEEGWFPVAILESARGLTRLGYHRIIDKFIGNIRNVGNNKTRTLELVLEAIDDLLQYHPSFRGNFGQFMKLAHFEQLLRLTEPNASDHVLHSFRVFLAGCPVVNEFYDEFRKAHGRCCIMNEKRLRVEYAWLLTAIFHDIGRPKEGAQRFMVNTLDDEDMEITVRGRKNRWTRKNYIAALRVAGSLGAFVVEGNVNMQWDGGSIDDEDASKFTAEWINIYDSMKSHAVISAFDFLGDILEKAGAVVERKHRSLIVTHAVPAALSILLHDWKIWPEMKQLKLVPVNALMLPMAALLVYIDTWDNYKRHGDEPTIFIKAYTVDSGSVCVKIEWGDSELLKDAEVGYVEYRKNIENLLFGLDIEYGLVGTV
jgi:hypothetical protein